jgi:type I restriction enzyme M protein
MFIDASREYREGKAQNYLRDEDIDKIARVFHAAADMEGYARVVPIAQIEAAEWNLNISRYVAAQQNEEHVDLAGALKRLAKLEAARDDAEARMRTALKGLGL